MREKIEKDTKNTNKKNYLLPENLLNDIFNKIFFDPDFVDVRLMSFEVFRCFQSLFEYINVQQKTLEINHRNLFRILKFSNILGRDYFWQILIYNSNERVKNIMSFHLTYISLKDFKHMQNMFVESLYKTF